MEERKAGVLLHISSLPSNYGIGTFGVEAYNFVDFLYASKISIWQILPLTLTSFGDSPYQSPSSKGLNPYFIDLDFLNQDGLLAKDDYVNIDWGNNPDRVDYNKIFNNRYKVLKIAYKNFKKTDKDFLNFKEKAEYRDFAIFMTLKELHNQKPWYEWDEAYKNYKDDIEIKVIKDHADEVDFYEWTQFIFLKQYCNLKEYAHKHGIQIMGDISIYVARDSVELWKYPNLFQVDEKHNPTRVAGCPPDCFSEDGQLWGNPLYDWNSMKKNNFEWWNERINYNLNLYDLMRIDHFRGFSGYYSIPGDDKTARNGLWIKGPGKDLFLDKLNYPIIAEDLGLLDDDFYKMMEFCGYPGMKVLTQGFDGDINSIWKPRNYKENFYAYTATHDSQTTKQFIDELNEKDYSVMLNDLKNELDFFDIIYKEDLTKEQIVRYIVELDIASKAKVAIIPMQDFNCVGKEGRMNLPSTVSTLNWSYRLKKKDFDLELATQIKKMIEKYRRD